MTLLPQAIHELPAGTVVHLCGIPVELVEPVKATAAVDNWQLIEARRADGDGRTQTSLFDDATTEDRT